MDNQSTNPATASHNYPFSSTSDYLDLYNAISKRLVQAQALACAGGQCEMDTIKEELVDAYFWALWDILSEAKSLFEKLHEKVLKTP